MSYEEWKDNYGYLSNLWLDEKGNHSRIDGPAFIQYFPDGSIYIENFYIAGSFLGQGKRGFWMLWDRLTEEERQAPDLLKYLVRFS